MKESVHLWESPWGPMGAGARNGRIVRILLPGRSRSAVQRALKAALPDARLGREPFEELIDLISRYFRGEAVSFSSVRCETLQAPAFTRAVWAACRRIGYGRTVSYGQLARRARRPAAARAAAGAMARNPLPLVIPCHRVVAANGLGGFSAGIGLKRRLLSLEGSL